MNELDTANVEVKERVRQHWGNRAAEFDDRPNHGLQSEPQHQAWLNLLRHLAGPSPLRVLDLGCGTGFLALLLAELGHDVTGVDLAPEMLAIARQKATAAGLALEFRLGDAETLVEPDGWYDVVVARHLIWTLPNPAAAVREWQRVLRPGGRIALFEGHWENQVVQAEYEPIRARLPFFGGLPSEQLVRFLTAEGLCNVAVEPLMDATLWGELPQRPRYLVTGRVGEQAPSQ